MTKAKSNSGVRDDSDSSAAKNRHRSRQCGSTDMMRAPKYRRHPSGGGVVEYSTPWVNNKIGRLGTHNIQEDHRGERTKQNTQADGGDI